MSETNDHVLDMEVIGALRALEEDGAPGLFDEIVELFLSDTPTRIAGLVQASASGDMKSVEAAAHSLKSSCGNLGATVLVDLFRRIEMLSRENIADEIPELVSQSEQEFDRVQSALLETK